MVNLLMPHPLSLAKLHPGSPRNPRYSPCCRVPTHVRPCLVVRCLSFRGLFFFRQPHGKRVEFLGPRYPPTLLHFRRCLHARCARRCHLGVWSCSTPPTLYILLFIIMLNRSGLLFRFQVRDRNRRPWHDLAHKLWDWRRRMSDMENGR